MAQQIWGEHKGLQKFIKDISPNFAYIWCDAHKLNLAATDILDDIIPVKSLVGLLHTTAAFFSNSCKRMSVWKSISSENSIRSEKLQKAPEDRRDTGGRSKRHSRGFWVRLKIPRKEHTVRRSRCFITFKHHQIFTQSQQVMPMLYCRNGFASIR